MLRGTVKEFKDDELADRAAALTYYGVLALFPALLVLVSLLGLAGESATKQVLDNLQKLAPGSARDVITDAVQQLQGHSGVGSLLAVVGLVVAVWSASGYIAAFIRTSNAVGSTQVVIDTSSQARDLVDSPTPSAPRGNTVMPSPPGPGEVRALALTHARSGRQPRRADEAGAAWTRAHIPGFSGTGGSKTGTCVPWCMRGGNATRRVIRRIGGSCVRGGATARVSGDAARYRRCERADWSPTSLSSAARGRFAGLAGLPAEGKSDEYCGFCKLIRNGPDVGNLR